jgi:hypothetical protein
MPVTPGPGDSPCFNGHEAIHMMPQQCCGCNMNPYRHGVVLGYHGLIPLQLAVVFNNAI